MCCNTFFICIYKLKCEAFSGQNHSIGEALFKRKQWCKFESFVFFFSFFEFFKLCSIKCFLEAWSSKLEIVIAGYNRLG